MLPARVGATVEVCPVLGLPDAMRTPEAVMSVLEMMNVELTTEEAVGTTEASQTAFLYVI